MSGAFLGSVGHSDELPVSCFYLHGYSFLPSFPLFLPIPPELPQYGIQSYFKVQGIPPNVYTHLE